MLLVPPVGEHSLAALAHHDRGAGVLAHRQHAAGRDVRVLQQVARDVPVVRRGLGVIEDGSQLLQVRGTEQVGDVTKGRPAQQRQRLRIDGKKGPAERLPGFHPALGDLPVGGLVVPERQQIHVGELSHSPEFRTASSTNTRDVGRVEEVRKIMPLSRTSRLVWVSATLYGDGVRRRCATRCPRPLVDLLATQCPRLRRQSGSAVAPKLVISMFSGVVSRAPTGTTVGSRREPAPRHLCPTTHLSRRLPSPPLRFSPEPTGA